MAIMRRWAMNCLATPFFKGTYKLVKNLPPYGDGRWRLYDIMSDPGETTDLSAAEPKRFASMHNKRGDG